MSIEAIKTRHALALTMGEPAGIGPDITLLAWQELKSQADMAFVVVGDIELLRARAEILGLSIAFAPVTAPSDTHNLFADALPVLPVPLAVLPQPGQPAPENAPSVISSIEKAVELASNGDVAGIVTNPIHKAALYEAGFEHAGHTDFLAHLCSTKAEPLEVAMMLASDELRVVPVTIHIPLRQVARQLTHELIVKQAMLTITGLKEYFGLSAPRLAISGLNPHAGENGHLGCEENEIIEPAIAALRSHGIAVSGPLPADTMFHPRARAEYDAALCMYHDQALIAVKTIDFDNSVNITLGLPFIRTSPDHGTALALAGTGKANPAGLIAAIKQAAEFARQRPGKAG